MGGGVAPTKLFESDVEERGKGKLEVTLPSKKKKKSVGSVLQTQDNQSQLIEIKECFGKGRSSQCVLADYHY